MDAYLNFMTSVIEFWKNWIESTAQLGMSALTAAFIPKPRVFVRTSPPPGEHAGGTMKLWDVGQAAPPRRSQQRTADNKAGTPDQR